MAEHIEVLTHSSIRVSGPEGVIYFDPYQVKDAANDADFILVTHDHFDHFSVEDIEKVAKKTSILVVPENMKDKAKEAEDLVGSIVTVSPGSQTEVAGLYIEAVPSYNVGKKFHPQSAGWVGYIVKVDGKRIYVAGDTDVNDDIKKVQCDIAMVPIGGTYTMDAGEAAELVNIITPATAIPTHYGSVAGKKEDAEIFRKAVKDGINVEVIMQY